MNIDRIMHLRAIKGIRKDGSPQFDENKRGVTVIGSFIWNEAEHRQDIIFSWAIQDPRDQYCKKTGIERAKDRMENGIIVQTNYENRFPMKYQFFNAIANTREFFHSKDNTKVENVRFVDLTFYALAEIAEKNDWFINVPSKQIPSIHPDILINYIHRMNKVQIKMCGITNIIGRSPFLTDLVNKSYGV